MKRFALLVIGLLLLPVIPAVTLAVFDSLPAIFVSDFPWVAPEPLAVFLGYVVWTLVFLFIPISSKIYVLGHELTHALWGLLTFSKVGRLHIGEEGGSVEISNPGFFTTLAPYFVPFYLIVILLLRLAIGLFVEMTPYCFHWLFLIGLAYGFHITYTVKSLIIHQPDIRVYGRVISYVVIIIANLLIFGYGFVAVTPATLPGYHRQLVARTYHSYEWAIATIADGAKDCASLWNR